MSLKELFPTYPLGIKSPPKSRIKFGTRNLYVDLPWQAYYFLQVAMSKAVEGKLTKEEVTEEWRKFLQANKDFLTLHGKPFVSVSLKSTSFSEKDYLKLDVKWDLFTEYLEEKSIRLLSEIEERETESIMEVYREIWINFFGITGTIVPSKPAYFPSTRERFRKLLRRTGDYFYIENLLDQLEGVMVHVEEVMKDKVPSIELYITNLIMDTQHLRALIDVVDIPAAYLLLRNLLENFIKLFVYLKVGSFIDPNVVLYSMFLYEYETSGIRRMGRIYSLNRFSDECIRKFLKIFSAIPPNETLDLPEFITKLKEKHIPTLGVNPKVLEEFSENYSLNKKTNLDKLYSACSSVIHNQPPLPFFSLFEVKFFKHFLEKYLRSFQVTAEKLIDEKINLKRIQTFPLPKEKASLKECLRATYLLEVKHGKEVKDIIKRALTSLQKKEVKGLNWIWIRPLTLISVFNIISPSFSRLRDFSLIEEDVEDVVKKLEPLTFKVSIRDELSETLNTLQEILLPDLEKYEVFSSLESMEQKRKVLFYLLLHYLPEIVEDLLKG
jgi:hypothetical protein